ncbi:MAG: allantoinase AllB [Vicinamibacteraceae bacterium]
MTRGLSSLRIVRPDGVGPGTVLFSGGRIEAVVPERIVMPDVEDVGDRVVSPGLVDSHVHVNDPGRDWEGFETATRAAAAGGVTTLVDMPLNSSPVTTTPAALAAKLAASEGKRFVDVGLWAGVVPGNGGDLISLARAGVLGGKAFMVPSGIDEFPHVGERELREAMPVLRDHGLPLLAHAELDVGRDLGAPTPADPRSYAGYVASRPRAWEDAAIGLLIDLCRETRCPVHIVHLGSASAVDAIRRARDEGLPLTVETCPHYLCLEAEAIPDGATQFKCAPPIRDRENRDALWAALFEGVIDAIVSDHSPCPPAMKLAERGDFMAAWGGIASLQHGLSVVWTEAARRGARLDQLSAWMSTAPARLAGRQRSKGRLATGYDADLVVWDPDESFTVSADGLFYRHPISPYVGAALRGRVHRTFLRGHEVYDGQGHPAGPIGRVLLHREAA